MLFIKRPDLVRLLGSPFLVRVLVASSLVLNCLATAAYVVPGDRTLFMLSLCRGVEQQKGTSTFYNCVDNSLAV